jgi:hypothetical protein
MKTLIFTCIAFVFAVISAQAREPFVITSFASTQPGTKLRVEDLGTPCFTVQFKIKDPHLSELERAVVYLFDDQHKLIHTLTETDPRAFRPGTEIKQKSMKINYPNMLNRPEDLKADTIYTLVFRHMLPRKNRTPKAEFRWKYAIAVIGADDVFVYRVLPAWKKIEELEFPEKDQGVEN